MRYLKKFNELIKEDKKNVQEEHLGIESILRNIFKTFKTKENIEDIFTEEKLDKALDVYDSFIDMRDIIQLEKDDLQGFADNLGVGGENDILIAIINRLYEEKFKRSFEDDIDDCIDSLKEYQGTEKYIELAKKYLIELQKIKDKL